MEGHWRGRDHSIYTHSYLWYPWDLWPQQTPNRHTFWVTHLSKLVVKRSRPEFKTQSENGCWTEAFTQSPSQPRARECHLVNKSQRSRQRAATKGGAAVQTHRVYRRVERACGTTTAADWRTDGGSAPKIDVSPNGAILMAQCVPW